MREESLISIIVPVYNVEKYLDCCIKSLISQTYSNLEIILVDDGSKDLSGAICDRWAEKDERIKVIHKENGGLSSARNCGIENASGEYYAFLDSDDFVNEKFIEILYDLCQKWDCKLALCDYLEVAETENDVPELENGTSYCISREDMYNNLFTNQNVKTVIACNKLYGKDIFNGLRYPVGRINEDEAIIHKVIEKVNKVAVSNLPLYYYRQTTNSISRGKYNLKMLDELQAKQERLDFFAYNEMNSLFQMQLYAWCSRAIYHFKQLETLKSGDVTSYQKELLNQYISKYRNLDRSLISFKKNVRLYAFYLFSVWMRN